MPTNFTGYLGMTFINVLVTLIFIYWIRVFAVTYDVPFLKTVVSHQTGSNGQ